MMKFAPEGYPFIFATAGIALLVLALGLGPGIPFVLLAVFMLYFFRDPDRTVPDEKDIFVSPADGKVIVVRDVREEEHLHAETKQVSIFMSPLNVHVNRVPCDCTVKAVAHVKGKFMAAYHDEASMQNEHIDMVIETRYGNVLVRQVAGFVARRAVCRKRAGDVLRRGERYGVIKFSSRVDLFLPKETVLNVRVGDTVMAGESILGRFRDRA